MQSDMYYDAVIAGCGVAGLYTALNLPETSSLKRELHTPEIEAASSAAALSHHAVHLLHHLA